MNPHLFLTCVVVIATTLVAGAAEAPAIAVHQNAAGAYVVTARFHIGQPVDVARDVLTDYDNIPRFMFDVVASKVVERGDGVVWVNQEAVSEYMFFAKRVHLVLEIEEGAHTIRFRDRCNKSFHVYEGMWTLTPREGGTELTYELIAKPAFSVPNFVIRKLLKRDAQALIEQLRAEITARGMVNAR